MRCTDLCEACSRHSNLMMETTSTALSHASYARSQTGKIIFPMKDAKDCVFYGGNVVLGLIAFLATTENAGVIHIVCVYVCVSGQAPKPHASRVPTGTANAGWSSGPFAHLLCSPCVPFALCSIGSVEAHAHCTSLCEPQGMLVRMTRWRETLKMRIRHARGRLWCF